MEILPWTGERRKGGTLVLVLKTAATAADARITNRTDTNRWQQGQGESRRPCVRACAHVLHSPILITWGIPLERWIQKRHAINEVQYSQIAVRRGSQVFRMVAKSLDPRFLLKFQRRLKFAPQQWIRRTIYGFWRLRQMCAHCTWSNISFLSFFLFCFKSESGLIKMKHLRSLTSGSVLTPANAGCYNYPAGVSESPPTADAICLLTSTRATAEPDFPRLCEWGELRLRNFGSPRTILSPERRRKKKGVREWPLGDFKRSPEMRKEKSWCSLITEILQPPLENCFNSKMRRLDPPLLLSSGAQTHKRVVWVFLLGFLSPNLFRDLPTRTFICSPVDAGRKCSAESRASACVWRPSSNGATRGTRRYAYLSTVSKNFFVALRGIRPLIGFSTFPPALPSYYPLISSRLIFRLRCPEEARESGFVLYLLNGRKLHFYPLPQATKDPHHHHHTHTGTHKYTRACRIMRWFFLFFYYMGGKMPVEDLDPDKSVFLSVLNEAVCVNECINPPLTAWCISVPSSFHIKSRQT